MAVATSQPETQAAPLVEKKPASTSTLMRVTRYTAVRLVTLFITVVIGVYLTIMIANMGGYVDTIMRNDIRDQVTQAFASNRMMQNLDSATKAKLIKDQIAR